MPLPEEEIETLKRLGLTYTVEEENGLTCVVISDFRLPPGMTLATSNLLIRLNPGFPDVAPDMWWFDPPVMRSDRAVIPQTEHFENYLGRRWQRWSRHFQAGQWQSGIDCLESFVALIRLELARHTPPAAACA